MTIDDILWRLAQLASLQFQERFVIAGTKDEYVLDVELLEDVDAIQYMLERSDPPVPLNEEQVASLADLITYIRKQSAEALRDQSRLDAANHIRNSEIWMTLRQKAANSLSSFGALGANALREVEDQAVPSRSKR